MPVPFFTLDRQIPKMQKEIEKSLQAVIQSGKFILGPNVAALEEEIAAYCGTRFSVGVASGTDALHLALRAAGVKAGDEVITSPFTFVATIEVICYIGAKVVFADIDPETFNLSFQKIAEKITPKTKAILPVHLYGQMCDMEKIMALAKKHNLVVIEDACQAIGAKMNNKKAGSFGEAGGFSFFPTKNLGAFGDGGIISTNSEEIANACKVLRGHGSQQTYMYEAIGYNSRLDEMQAALLRIRLKHLDTWHKQRQENAHFYCQKLKDVEEIKLPKILPGAEHIYNQFTLRTKTRDALKKFLAEKQIGSMVYYPLSLHLHPAYQFLGYKKGDFPESESAQSEVLSLPIFPELTKKEIKEVCSGIKTFFSKK